MMPSIMERNKDGFVYLQSREGACDFSEISTHCSSLVEYRFLGIFWKSARIGERLSPYISICCVVMAVGFGVLVVYSRYFMLISTASSSLYSWDIDGRRLGTLSGRMARQ